MGVSDLVFAANHGFLFSSHASEGGVTPLDRQGEERNAFATHDLELFHKKFGTSLGSSPQEEMSRGNRAFPRGEEHHLRLINEARRAGSLKAFVTQGDIQEGSAIRAAVEAGVCLLMAGSIRDDGPLPGVMTDTAEATRRLREEIQDAGLVMTVGTYLHSSAALNQLPATTPRVVVDVNHDVVGRILSEHGLDAAPVVAGAAHFLKNLCLALGLPIDPLAGPTTLGDGGRANKEREKTPPEPDAPIRTGVVTQAGVAPGHFYTTTNEPTEIKLPAGQWFRVEGQKMDGIVVVDSQKGSAAVKVFRDLRVGDTVVVGRDGVRTTPLSQKETPKTIREVVEKLVALKRERSPVLLVAGSGLTSEKETSRSVAELIRKGYIHRIHCGTDLPISEVVQTREGIVGKGTIGDQVRALNGICAHGGLGGDAFVQLSPQGIFAEAKRKECLVVVSASPNDVGILPGTLNDTLEAQRKIRKAYKGCGLVLNVASVLHSIAAGNLGAGDIPVVVVDRDRFAINKLADRGTVQAHGFHMEASRFFAELAAEIARLETD